MLKKRRKIKPLNLSRNIPGGRLLRKKRLRKKYEKWVDAFWESILRHDGKPID